MSKLITGAEARELWAKEKGRWPNFALREMSCTCCGEVWWAPDEFDRAQRLRTSLNRPVKFNSTHRCYRNNARVGGAPKSKHKEIAFDFSLLRPQPASEAEMKVLQRLMLEAGFSSFGLYRTFIHTDSRPGRFWIVGGGKAHLPYFKRAA